MGRRRDYLEILSRMIEACTEGRGITRLMMLTKLNYPQTKKYLNEALAKGLIEIINDEEEGRQYYRATGKGLKLKEVVEELKAIVSRSNQVEIKLIDIRVRPSKIENIEITFSIRKRDKLTLYACILSNAIAPARFTELCNNCLINWASCSKIINKLISIELINVVRSEESGVRYKTSKAGLYFIKKYREAINILKNI